MVFTAIARCLPLLFWGFIVVPAVESTTNAAQTLEQLETQAIRQAAEQAGESVVRIDVLSGTGKPDNTTLGKGPTSGVIVSSDGWIVSSMFAFTRPITSIMVTLPKGQRLPAQLVSTDHSRQLVLLRMQANDLPVLPAVPEEDVRVGAWAIALGRAAPEGVLSLSVGIVSAKERISGKVLQTDAKISPHNYGGPLVDIYGRGLGVLLPLAPRVEQAIAGSQWYDSGIGFAVPLAHVMDMLPQMQEGNDLYPGILGVSLEPGNPYVQKALLAATRPNSPARKAGLQAGDQIVGINGQPIDTQMALRRQLGHRYAGETIKLVVRRGDRSWKRVVQLANQIEPFAHAFLGVLPQRTASVETNPGITLRYVYPDSPAAAAHLRPGDRIVRLAEHPVTSSEQALAHLNTRSPGDKLLVTSSRGKMLRQQELTLGSLPVAIPTDLPEPWKNRPPTETTSAPVELKLVHHSRPATLYVPPDEPPPGGYGIVVWLHEDGFVEPQNVASRWQNWCDSQQLILLLPQANNGLTWQRTDASEVGEILDALWHRYPIDSTRVVLAGRGTGGTMAYRLALQQRPRVRGLLLAEAPWPLDLAIPANDPVYRLAIFSTRAEKSPQARAIDTTVAALEAARYPVTARILTTSPHPWNDQELKEIAGWIDTLDRL